MSKDRTHDFYRWFTRCGKPPKTENVWSFTSLPVRLFPKEFPSNSTCGVFIFPWSKSVLDNLVMIPGSMVSSPHPWNHSMENHFKSKGTQWSVTLISMWCCMVRHQSTSGNAIWHQKSFDENGAKWKLQTPWGKKNNLRLKRTRACPLKRTSKGVLLFFTWYFLRVKTVSFSMQHLDFLNLEKLKVRLTLIS